MKCLQAITRFIWRRLHLKCFYFPVIFQIEFVSTDRNKTTKQPINNHEKKQIRFSACRLAAWCVWRSCSLMHAATFSHIVFFSTLTPEGARMKFQNLKP
ncbi:CLUMA_CG009525, isoform A [Clunio marinus]|uniref:CLUMA_CG009525, isoform A n=1 Tax=Clunio marinus TaxID=568069 RepID=A0A1J1ICC7_9DIPT|nr:CLUMA_CG009525, isoform A [Clunio marinus]